MTPSDFDRWVKVRRAAVAKWGDRRIALEELHGVWTLKALTGDWWPDMRYHGSVFLRERSIVYWTGSSLEDAEKVVGLR